MGETQVVTYVDRTGELRAAMLWVYDSGKFHALVRAEYCGQGLFRAEVPLADGELVVSLEPLHSEQP